MTATSDRAHAIAGRATRDYVPHMADVVREIERKYQFTPQPQQNQRNQLPDLRVRGVDSAVDAETVELDAVYYDTEDGRLAADGITLRRRTGGSDSGWHLKLPVEPGVRDEIREPLTEVPLTDAPPRTLTALVRSRIRSRALVPVMRLHSARSVRTLLDGDGTPLAEVSVDRVRAQRLPDGGTAEWAEVEAELAAAGGAGLLDRIEKRLLKAGLRPASAASKLAHALAATAPGEAAGPAAAPPATPEPGSAGDHVLRYVRAQLTALVTLDPAVRRDLPDSVHRMRVATRRLRSCFRSYGKVLDREVTDPVGAELKWLAGELGYDRDREVLHARLAERLAELPGGLQPGPVQLAPVRARLLGAPPDGTDTTAAGSRERLLAVLDGERYLALLETLTALLERPPLRPKASGAPGKVTAGAARRDTRRLAGRIDTALALSPGEERDVALHRARKAAKRARYAAEAARPALGKKAKRHAKRLTRVQDLLGEHQDSVLARHALLAASLRAHAAGEETFTYGMLYERECARAAGCERELPDLWHSVRSAARPTPFGTG